MDMERAGDQSWDLCTIADRSYAGLVRAIRTTVNCIIRLDTVADNLTTAVCTSRCNSVNCAFEAVEHVHLAGYADFKALVVVVAANLAFGHAPSLF